MVADLAAAAVVLTLAAVAFCGGAFDPAERLLLGPLLALAAAVSLGLKGRCLDRQELAGLLFLTVAGAAAISTGTSWLAAKETLASWILAWVLWAALRTTGSATACWSLRLLAAAGAIVAVTVIAECILQGSIRQGGFFDNPNVAGSVLLAGLVGAAATRGGRPWMRTVLVVLLGVAVGFTGSRAGLLALAAATAVLVPPGRHRRLGVLGMAAVAVSLVAFRFWQAPDILAWHRIAIWRAVMSVWLTHPWLGVGPGGLGDAAGPFRLLHADHIGHRQFLVVYAESTPLALLVQTGLLGVATLALGLWWWHRQSGALRAHVPPLRAAVTVLVVFGLFHDLGSLEGALWWWAATLGLIEAATPAGPAKAQDGGSTRFGWLPALAVLFAVLWGIVQPAWARSVWLSGAPTPELADRALRGEPWYGEPAHVMAVQLLQADHWRWEQAAESLMWISTALRVHPGSSKLWSDLGRIRIRTAEELGATETEVTMTAAALDTACRLDPWVPWTWLERARLERMLGHTDAAVEFVHTALDSEPFTVRAWLLLARLELDRGRIDVAREALQRAKELESLATREGLSNYERELLDGPDWQVRELDEALR